VQTYNAVAATKYEGTWKQDKRYGPSGTVYFNDGSIMICEWLLDEPVLVDRATILVYPNGDKYAGECTPNQNLGNSTYYHSANLLHRTIQSATPWIRHFDIC
jgi:hypothetical protein